MSDKLDKNGLTLKTATEILDNLSSKFKEIFGDDINIEADSPDGQIIRLVQQMATDVREMIRQTYTSLDPDQAIGVVLDQRVAFNNIERIGGDFTIITMEITNNKTLPLNGLDDKFNDPNASDAYTVQDDQGNQFLLIDSVDILTVGTHSFSFRAKDLGKVETSINTINTQFTVVLGITEVNNPTAPTTIGDNQETDFELRKRRRSSVANRSIGYIDSIESGLHEVDGVVEAKVYENETSEIDANGLPPNSVWCIVEGGANSDIGKKIYQKKDAGCQLKGIIEVDVLRPNGDFYTAKFDRPIAENLFIRFSIKPLVEGTAFSIDEIKQHLEDNLKYNIGQSAETSSITSLLYDFIIDGAPLSVEIGKDGVDYFEYLETSEINNKFTVDSDNIEVTILV